MFQKQVEREYMKSSGRYFEHLQQLKKVFTLMMFALVLNAISVNF